MDQKDKIEIVKMATAAAKKWFYETFDDDLLYRMEEHRLIEQAEGFSVGMVADLQVAIELEVLGDDLSSIEMAIEENKKGEKL